MPVLEIGYGDGAVFRVMVSAGWLVGLADVSGSETWGWGMGAEG